MTALRSPRDLRRLRSRTAMLRVHLVALNAGRREERRRSQGMLSGQGNDMCKKEVIISGLVCQRKSYVMSVVRETLFVPVIYLLCECEDATLTQTLCNVSPESCRAAQCGVGRPGPEIVTSSPGKWGCRSHRCYTCSHAMAHCRWVGQQQY